MVTLPERTPKKKDRVDRSEKIGEVKITFFKSRHFDVDVSGQVTIGYLQRSRRALYKAVSYNRLKLRRENQARVARVGKAVEEKAKLEAEAVEEANAAKAVNAAAEVAAAEPKKED